MSDWTWLALPAVMAAHDRLLALHGGLDGMRDLGALEGALARPQNLAAYGDPDVAELAASYCVGIAKAHAFVDGNKRAALATALMFLDLNGYVVPDDEPETVLVVEGVATGAVDLSALASWFRDRMRHDESR